MWNLILLILFIGITSVILFNAFHKENNESRLYMISVSILIALSVIIIYQEMAPRQNFTNSHSLITSYNKAANQIFTVLDDLNLEWWPTEGTLIGCLRWGSNFGMTENGVLVTDTDIDIMVRVQDDQNWQVVKKEIEKRLKTLDPEWIKFESHNHDIGISREPKFSCYYNKRWGLDCYGNDDIHVDIHSYMVDEKNNSIFMDPVCNGNNKCVNKYPFQKWGGFAPYRGLIVDDKGLFKKCKFGNMTLNCPYQSRKLLSNWNDNEYGTGEDLHLPRGNCVFKNSCWTNGDNILSSTDKLRLKNIAKKLHDEGFESFYSYYVKKTSDNETNTELKKKYKELLPGIHQILYLNLDKREDRMREIFEEFQKLEVNPSNLIRISAEYTPENGAIGCLMSHIKALQKAISEFPGQNILICEDDLHFQLSKEETLEKMRNFVKDPLFDIRDVWMISNNAGEVEDTHNSDVKRLTEAQMSSGM